MANDPTDWVTRAADEAVRHHEKHGTGDLITCASGASPSGPIHLGNLREFITPHFVAGELRRRGLQVRHLHSWDDFDRYRKVPAGAPPEWKEHIGRPLTAVPDPWECHASWSDHFKAPLRGALAELGVEMEEVSQTERYRAGAYRDQVLHAVAHRAEIDAILGRYRTKKVEPESEQEAAELEDSVANEPDGAGTGAMARFPYKPYCRQCGRDTVTVTSYDDATHDLAYTCDVCGFSGVTNLDRDFDGKLVWKVDWPMRWAYEGVDFEPGGLDHSTPGSSYTVGKEMVGLFGGVAPSYVAYAFVGFAGMQKMSSSAGGVPIPADALSILEAPMVRWLYVRRQPKQAFTIDFGPEVVRLYDEWDTLTRKAGDPAKRDAQVLAWERAVATAAGPLPRPKVVVPFRLLSSVADVTAGSAEQVSRIVGEAGHPHDSVADLEPRLTRAMTWMNEYVPESDRTTVRTTRADRELTAQEQGWIDALLERLPDPFELDALTTVIYGVPKLAHGLSLEDRPTEPAKADQKAFFGLLYDLLVGAESGPRLPTLFLALGPEKVRALLG